MNILIFRPSPNALSLSTYNVQEVGLAKALVRKGHSCDVAYYTEKKENYYEIIEFDGNKSIRILWLHGYGIFNEGIYPSLKKYLAQYDIIQVGGYIGIMSCWLNRHYQNKVVNYQGPYFCKDNRGDNIKASVFDKILLPFSKKKSMVIGTKSILATEYLLGKGLKNVKTLGVGIDLDKIDPTQEETQEYFKQLENDKCDENYLLYIGKLEERRNIKFAFEILQKIIKERPNIKLIIIGSGDAKIVEDYFSYARDLGVLDYIIYKERIEQKYLKQIYKMADIFILPTRYEIFGMVLLEAMYFGLPVVTTYNGGSSTLINDNNGVIIREFDSAVWAEKIIKLMDNKDLRTKMGTEAYKTIRDGYTWDVLSNDFLKLYNERLKGN